MNRYRLKYTSEDSSLPDMLPAEDGDWVKWEDMVRYRHLHRDMGHATQEEKEVELTRLDRCKLRTIAVDAKATGKVATMDLLCDEVLTLLDTVDELERHDVRELLKCPECGGEIKLGIDNWSRLTHGHITTVFWYCQDDVWRNGLKPVGGHRGPFADTSIAALLAWHGKKEK